MDLQFPWTRSKKTLTVAHRNCLKSSTERLIFSYNGRNWELTLYYYRKDGRRLRRKKRHSRISSRRWEMHEISVRKFRSSPEGYKFIEVERKTILEICRFWNRYLENRGIKDSKLIGDVIYERNLDS
jgi:hypothetical protein